MIRRGNLVAFWRPFVVALIVLLALVLWLGSSDTQVLIHNSKSKMRGELTPWILGYLCKIWWKWELPGVKMRRLCRPSWSSLGNRSPASRGSADLLLLDVGTIWEQFALFLPLFHCEDVLCLGDRTFASSTPATSRNHGYWGCQQGWHWLLDADINVNSADRVNHCQKQTWTWPLKICHVPSRHPGILQWSEHDVPHSDGSCCCCPSSWPTSEDRSWVSWDFDYFQFQVGRSLYDNHIVQDTHVDWNRQEESACQVSQVLFVSTITLPPSQFYGDHMYDLHVHLQHSHLRHDVPHLEGEVHLVVVEFNSSSRWCWSKCTGRTWSKARTASMARRAVMAKPSLASRSQSKLGRTRKRCQILINNYTCCISWFEMQGYVLPGGGICGQYWRHRNTHSFWAQRYIEGGIHDRRHIEGGTLSNL